MTQTELELKQRIIELEEVLARVAYLAATANHVDAKDVEHFTKIISLVDGVEL